MSWVDNLIRPLVISVRPTCRWATSVSPPHSARRAGVKERRIVRRGARKLGADLIHDRKATLSVSTPTRPACHFCGNMP